MKKILISLLIVLLLVLCFKVAISGLQIGNFEILGFSQILEKNQKIDDIILEATALASTDLKKTQDDIATDIKKLTEEKKKYDELVAVSTNENGQIANQYQKYEIEYLWTIIGNHATKEGVILKMDLVAGTGDNVYNLNFTVTGAYIGIADFIYDIENDSALGFKIENFSLVPSASTDSLKATFVCKDITIRDVKSSTKASTKKDSTDGTTKDADLTNSDTTNTTTDTKNTNNTSNSTNSNTTSTSNSTGTNSTSNSNSTKSNTTNNSSDEDDLENELTKLDRN